MRGIGGGGDLPRGLRWLRDGAHYLQFDDRDLMQIVDARTGARTPFHDAAKMQAALIGAGMAERDARRASFQNAFDLSTDETRALLSYGGDLWAYDFAKAEAIRLTQTPALAETNAQFSPDGSQVAFVQNFDLWTVPVRFGAAPPAVITPRRLTTDGGAKIYNGRLDWVYEEEVYGRGETDAYKWSPDSRRIAFLRLDETPVRPFTIVDHVAMPQETEAEDYPKAGAPNPLASLWTVTADGAGKPSPVDLSAYPETDRLIVRFGWTPKGAVVYQVQNRVQKWLDLNIATMNENGATAPPKRLFRETSPAWVDVAGEPVYLPDGSFLWQSDRTGYRHIYHVGANGAVLAPVTKGDWEVRDVYGADPKGQFVYFSALEHSRIAPHIYRARVDGTGPLVRLSKERDGTHSARFSPDFFLFLDTRSDLQTPPQLRVVDGATGKTVRTLGESAGVLAALAPYKRVRPELVRVPARDGFEMDGVLLRPADFDPAKKYPVFFTTYGGPAAPTVRDAWGVVSPWEQYLAQHGVIVWMCDNRSASGRGAKYTQTVYKNFGAGELADASDGLDWLLKQPWADKTRVGMYGWSFGGYFTSYALTHSPKFKLGIAGGTVTDWRLYDSIYTERYMDTPDANPAGYKASSPTAAAASLTGRLLLIHGTMDDNVHMQNTIQFIYALERAQKTNFDLELYPRSRHGVGDPALARHLRTVMTDYLLNKL